MFLDRIDVDSHGPLARVSLGPFSQSLTAIVAASGTGKTALVRFLRDSLTGTTPARDGLSHSQGRVVWAAADGFYHCRREPNGTPEGRRYVEFETRLVDTYHAAHLGRDAIVVDLPACVVDGIVTDTVLTRVHHCVQAAIASGLDQTTVNHDNSRDIEINDLRREIAELERQIHSHTLQSQHATARPVGAYDSFGLTLDMKRLRDRRAELALEISAIDARRDWATKADAEMDRRRRKRETFASIADDIERLRRQESDLRSRLADVEATLERMDSDATRADNRATIAKAYRNRLEQVETQLTRVRSVVREIRALGDHWFGGRGLTAQAGWLEQAIDGVSRVADEFSLDRPSRINSMDDVRTDGISELEIIDRGWSAALVDTMRIDDSVPASTVDVQRRIDAICRMVDNLVGRCEEHQSQAVEPQNFRSTRFEETRPQASSSRLTDWDTWAEAELDRHERRRHPSTGASDSMRPRNTSSLSGMPSDPANAGERFEPTRGLDRAERLLQEERTYRDAAQSHSGENIAWIAGVLNGISQRLRGLAGRRAAYGASNIDPLFHSRRDENSFTDPSNLGASLDPQAQVAAVRRCEREVVDVLRQLASRRDVMLRRIAEVQNQPLSQVASSLSDSQAMHDDPQLYQWIVRDRIVASEVDAKQREAALCRAKQQQAVLANDLKQTAERITDRVAEAETIRVYLRSLPVVHRYDNDVSLRARLVAEIKAIDEQLAKPQVHPSILQRHAQCVTRLRSLSTSGAQASGLAVAASDYLQKLSGGKLRGVVWNRGLHSSVTSHVEIDGHNEMTCSPAERFIASVAVRLAASDELARRGRALPVIIETPSLRHASAEGLNIDLRSLLQNCVDTLASFARRGRQVILLTDDAVVADAIMRVGGSVQSFDGARETIAMPRRNATNSMTRMYDVNRDFDVAWREANGDESTWRAEDRHSRESIVDDCQNPTHNFAPASATTSRFDMPVTRSSVYREQVTQPPRSETIERVTKTASSSKGRQEAIDVPFFLTGHSPIEQAPSIGARFAQRLREVGVQRVEHLLAASPKELASSLCMDDVDAVIVRRWQHECRMLCGVRKLQAFDARVLVGCGITHPRELLEIDPKSLVERVEMFLATDRGLEIKRSGTHQEITRLNDWLKQARSRSSNHSMRSTTTSTTKTSTTANPSPASSTTASSSSASGSSFKNATSVRSNSARSTSVSSTIARSSSDRTERDGLRSTATRFADVRRSRETDAKRTPGERESRLERDMQGNENAGDNVLKFYLQRSSDVEAGPSVGPRMAERLYSIGVNTVDDLLSRSASSIASDLKLSKVDAAIVRQWQQQAELVCRVPMLRGHDAQLLVAAGVTDAKKLAACEPHALLMQIEPIAISREGKAIIRGGKLPDLAEINEWISNAQQHRDLVAA